MDYKIVNEVKENEHITGYVTYLNPDTIYKISEEIFTHKNMGVSPEIEAETVLTYYKNAVLVEKFFKENTTFPTVARVFLKDIGTNGDYADRFEAKIRETRSNYFYADKQAEY